jgi:hypothetical protein
MFADRGTQPYPRLSAQSEESESPLLFFSFLALLAAFSSFFLRLRSALSSGDMSSSSRLLRFLLLLTSTSMDAPASASSADVMPVGGMAGAARTSDLTVVSATVNAVPSLSVLLKSLYEAFHLAGVFSLVRPNFWVH